MKTIICVHSINETDHITTLDTLCQDKTFKFEIPVKVLTRVSQKGIYERILENYVDYFNDLELVFESDDSISNLGRTKNFEIKYSYNLGFSDVFQFDDDITRLGDNIFSTPEQVIRRWFDLHEVLTVGDKSCVMTSVLKDLSKSKPDKLADLYGGICTQCTLINTERAVKCNLFYGDNDIVGHEDVDYRAQLISRGKTYYRFTDIVYGTEPLNTDTFSGDTLQERFTRQRDLFKEKWGDKYPWIIYTTSVINGIELDDVKLDPFVYTRQ